MGVVAPAAAVAGAALVLENHAMREEREWLKNELKLISDRVRVFSAGWPACSCVSLDV